ncbi:profilin-4 [Varanus komodoensis]|uniref:Profilin n=1 Tax=Varanus komodoensis TaxID=61221 RepID=A0A8D2LM80_VARKO|nr:profilin-4 [Varanus komodoensis]
MNQAQSLLLDGLTKTRHVANAALVRAADASVLASTPGFPVQSLAPQLVRAFYKDLLQVRREGMYFKERHYACVRADEHAIYLKGEDSGVVLAKTKAFVLVGTYAQGMHPSVCVEAVEKLAEYLRKKGN